MNDELGRCSGVGGRDEDSSTRRASCGDLVSFPWRTASKEFSGMNAAIGDPPADAEEDLPHLRIARLLARCWSIGNPSVRPPPKWS